MAAALIAMLSLVVFGLPIVLAIDGNARGLLLLGLSFLYGSGAIFIVLLALSIAHIPWTLLSVVVAAIVLWCVMGWLARRNSHPSDTPRLPTPHSLLPFILDLGTLITVIGYAFYATIAPLWEWDFWAIWGLKARLFLDHDGIDWRFLESHWNAFAHPDYPVLLPLNFDFVALLGGVWSDRWLGLLFVAWAVALLLVVRSLAARETSPLLAALLTFTLASLAVSRFVGMAEGPLIAFGGAGVLFVRRALFDDDGGVSWRHGAILLGLAANCKNEGLALLVAVTVAIIVTTGFREPRKRWTVLRLWPAYALTVPWLLLRATHVLATDIASGSVLARTLHRLPFAAQILGYLVTRLYDRWFWIALLAALLVAPAAARMRERFVLLATAIQLVFYIGSYFATPNEIRWHVVTSWPRLTDQIALPITYVVFLMLANYLLRGEESRHAEARSDD